MTLVARGLWIVVTRGLAELASPGLQSADTLLTVAVAAVALLLLAWFVAGVVLEALAVVPGVVGRQARRAADRLTPALATRVAVFVIGSAIGGAAMPGTAVADTVGGLVGPRVTATAPDPGFAPAGRTPAPDPGFVPSRPVVRPLPPTTVLGRGGVPAPEGVVVHRGDTLWAIAARELGPEADDAEVAARWPQWHAANRSLIGPDPDLILPGQVLNAPPEPARR